MKDVLTVKENWPETTKIDCPAKGCKKEKGVANPSCPQCKGKGYINA